MRFVNKQKLYILILGALMLSTVVILSAIGESRLDVYVSLFTVEYFACTALFQPRRKYFDVVGGGLFIVFCYIVAAKIWEIIR